MTERKLVWELGKCGLCQKAVVHEAGKRPLCNECAERQKELYMKIRALLRDFPDRRLGVGEVAKILAVDEREITHLIDSGRFGLAADGWKPVND